MIINQPYDAFDSSSSGSKIEVDNVLLGLVSDQRLLKSGREFSPLPMLGLPGCWDENEKLDFYLNESYFRPKKLV